MNMAWKQRNRSIKGKVCRATVVANDIEMFQPRVVIDNLQVVIFPARAVLPGCKRAMTLVTPR